MSNHFGGGGRKYMKKQIGGFGSNIETSTFIPQTDIWSETTTHINKRIGKIIENNRNKYERRRRSILIIATESKNASNI